MTDKVDLKPIQHLYLEHLIDADKVLGADKVAKLFEGTDIFFDPKSRELQGVVAGQIKPRGIQKEADYIKGLKDAAGEDLVLDLAEAKKIIDASPQLAGMSPEAFLNGVEATIKARWARLAENMKGFQGDMAFKATLDAIDTYSKGILLNDVFQARSVMPLNGIFTKTTGNILTFPRNLMRVVTKGRGIPILPHDTVSDNWMYMDQVAEAGAHKRHAARQAAIEDLRTVIHEGTKKNEPWSFEGNFEEAFKRLKPESQELLRDHIPAKKIHDILMIRDEKDPAAGDKRRAEALKAFAIAERPSFLGYWGGNATGWNTANVFNITGRHNNIYFAHSALGFLTSKAATGDENYDHLMQQEAIATRTDIRGDEGGFTNLFSVLLTSPCRVGHWCDPTPYRSWGDEAEMDGLGRTLDAGLLLFTSYKALGSWKEAWALRRLNGVWGSAETPGVFRVWKDKRVLNPTGAWKEARIAEEARLAEAGEDVSKLSKGWSSRAWQFFKDKAFGKLPPLDPALKKSLAKAESGGGKFMAKLTDGVILLYVTQNADKAMSAYYNPYDANHELDVDPYPNVLVPDPALYPAKK